MPKLSELTAHNLTTPSGSGLVLGADQGKILKDYIDDLSGNTSFNNPTFTGSVNMSGATTVTVPTVSAGDIGEKAANIQYVNSEIIRRSVLKGTLTNINLMTYKSNSDGLYEVVDAIFFNGETKFLFLQQIVGDEKTYQYVVSVTGKKYERIFGLDEEITTPWSTITLNSPTFTGTPILETTPSATATGKELITADWIKRDYESIAIRYGATNSLSGGGANILFGTEVGKSLTNGLQNTLIGRLSGKSITVGNNNTGIGAVALEALIGGGANIGIGPEALRALINGNYNIGIGDEAGDNATNINQSIFIGKASRAKNVTGDTNEIVIGSYAQGQGTNTVVLGNDSITDTYLKGGVRIDKFKIRNNYVLNNPSNFVNVLDISDVILTASTVAYSEELIISNSGNSNHLLSVGDVFVGTVTIDGDTIGSKQFTISSITDYNELLVYNPFFENYTYESSTSLSIIATNYVSIVDKTIVDTTDLDRNYNLNVVPKYTNIHSLGSMTKKWRNVHSVDLYSHDGAVNESDSRKKTQITPFTTDEINAAKQLSKEIGTYKWLSAIAEKGEENARKHIGMTVQRAIEIMSENNLNPFDYGFICYNEWGDEFRTIPAVDAKEAWIEEIKEPRLELTTIPATDTEPERQEIVEVEYVVDTIEHPAVEAKDAYQVQTGVAGSIYSFRYTELLAFICRGFEERLTALENK